MPGEFHPSQGAMKVKAERPGFPSDTSSLLKQFLTPGLFEQLAPLKTDSGFTLGAAIRSGLENPDSHIGIYAGDAQCYSLFSPVLDPIIQAYHGIKNPVEHRSYLVPITLPLLDPDREFVISTRIRVARNLKGFAFPPHINAQDRGRVESLVLQAVENLPQDLKGSYVPFSNLSSSLWQALLDQKRVFPPGDRFQDAAGINRDFPLCRGIFSSQDDGFKIWVNEEDHLRIISMDSSADMGAVFNRLVQGLDALTLHFGFAHDQKYGFLTACPTNIGTAMRAGVHIRLKNLDQHPHRLSSLVNQYRLQIRGTSGEKTRVDQAVYDISNVQRLGISEVRIVENLHAGVAALIQAEKSL